MMEIEMVVMRPVIRKSLEWTYSPPPTIAAATVREEKGKHVAMLQAKPTERQAAMGWNP